MANLRRDRGRLWARWALDPRLGAVDGLVVEWQEGIFSRVESARRPPANFSRHEIFENHLLTPGLLNAHCHLDYSFLRGSLPRGEGFVPWLRAMIAARGRPGAWTQETIQSEIVRAVNECLKEGTTEIWDIVSFGRASDALKKSGMAKIEFIEQIAPRDRAWDPNVPADALAGDGLSPHSAYSVAPRALSGLIQYAQSRHRPLAMHLAESPEERELLIQGQGRLRELFAIQFNYDPVEELGSGLSAIERARLAGALGPSLLAIHCNLPESGEVDLLAASQSVVVVCPCSHDFFGYPDYPLTEMRKAGVRLALGTDSLASNGSLSIRAEARSLLGWPGADEIPALDVLALMTGAGLGEIAPWGGRGRLERGSAAQWAVWRSDMLPNKPAAETLLALLLSEATKLSASSAIPESETEFPTT